MNKKLNRRSFLKSGIIGASGSIIGARLYASQFGEKIQEKPVEKNIIKRKLGNTGLELPIVSIGVMTATNPNIVRAAYNSGITHFDTAHVYQNGKNEVMVGQVLNEFPRDTYYVSTKIVPDYDTSNGWNNRTVPDDFTKDKFLEKLNTSLTRLNMDYVDILYLHMPPTREIALTERLLDALQTAKKQGKTRHIGVSTHENMHEIINTAAESGIYEVVLTAVNFKMEGDKKLFDSINNAAGKGIGIIAMKTMAGVYLDKEQTQKINCKAALKWVMKNENIHTSIPGMETFEHLTDNLTVMEDLELNDEEKKDLESYREIAGLFCNGCMECLGHCKKGLPVNQIMRAYMYAYGHKNLREAYHVLSESGIENDPCADCHFCTVKCKKGFHVKEKIAEISRIRNVPYEFLT